MPRQTRLSHPGFACAARDRETDTIDTEDDGSDRNTDISSPKDDESDWNPDNISTTDDGSDSYTGTIGTDNESDSYINTSNEDDMSDSYTGTIGTDNESDSCINTSTEDDGSDNYIGTDDEYRSTDTSTTKASNWNSHTITTREDASDCDTDDDFDNEDCSQISKGFTHKITLQAKILDISTTTSASHQVLKGNNDS